MHRSRSKAEQYGGGLTLLYKKETLSILNSLVNFAVCLDPRMSILEGKCTLVIRQPQLDLSKTTLYNFNDLVKTNFFLYLGACGFTRFNFRL